MSISRSVFVVLLCASVGAAQEAVPAAVLEAPFAPTKEQLMGHVRFLASDALGGRRAGTPEAAIAAAYVAAEFAKLGLTAAGDDGGFEQLFPGVHFVPDPNAKVEAGKPAKFIGKKVTHRNVLAWLPGTDAKLAERYILVGAHFDHLGTRGDQIFNGADDNASGVAGLLGVAQACVRGKIELRRSVLFVAFGAEEIGLRGSRHFVRKPPRSLQRIVTMINLDMISRGEILDQKSLGFVKGIAGIKGPGVGVLGTAQSPELSAITRAVFKAQKLGLYAPEDFPSMIRKMIEDQARGRADHAPFQERRIPFVFFSTGEHDDYHKPTDTIDKVDASVLWRITHGTYRVVLAVDARDTRPTFVAPKPKKARKGKPVEAKSGR